MNKQIFPVLILLLACMMLVCTGASANSWGLSGNLYRAVEQSKAWEDYTILVHALKSSARLIGATLFAEIAQALETAGKDGNEVTTVLPLDDFIQTGKEEE